MEMKKVNAEGYPDPTACDAVNNIAKEEKDVNKRIRDMMQHG